MKAIKILENGGVTSPKGYMASGVMAEIKKKDKRDVAIIYSECKATAAGVFTTNKVHAACVDVCRNHLADGKARAIVVNSGNANACTGEQGLNDTVEMAKITAQVMGMAIKPEDILVASTGVIGVPMPMERIEGGIYEAVLTMSRAGSHNAALAIMTTDLKAKEIAVEIELGGQMVRIGAIAKGSGMIHPNMATMLAFITTDAAISNECLQKMVKGSADLSYNMISVDRDTSTNDMMLILANGMAKNPLIDNEDTEDYAIFLEALNYVNIELAKMIAADGEGANHLLQVEVINAADEKNARIIARSVVGSNLVKAAVFGKDPNWGRALAAAGYSGADFAPELVDIYLGKVQVAGGGMGLPFDEAAAKAELEKAQVTITLDLKAGDCRATAWGCDLSYEYVSINADYRT